MSDRTWFGVTILACPDEAMEQVRNILVEDWDLATPDERALELALREVYYHDEFDCGEAHSVAAALSETGCTFSCWEDPKYEWLGGYYAFTPELGLFSAPCTSQGIVVIEAHDLWKMIDETPCEELAARLEKVTGRAWYRALQALASNGGCPRIVGDLNDD